MAQVGRPRIIESPDELLSRANAYFAQCEKDERPYTITGLALSVGLSGRDGLDEYGKRAEFSDIVKLVKARVEQAYEERMHGQSPTGAIFALKNMGWRDQQHIENTGNVNLSIRKDDADVL